MARYGLRMNVFISQPINGRSLARIKQEREDSINYLQNIYHTKIQVVNTFIDNDNPVYCLGEMIKKLAEADIAYFTKDWENYRECRIEHNICIEYNIKILEYKKPNVVYIKDYVNTKNQN